LIENADKFRFLLPGNCLRTLEWSYWQSESKGVKYVDAVQCRTLSLFLFLFRPQMPSSVKGCLVV
jgi:hypothetical protein